MTRARERIAGWLGGIGRGPLIGLGLVAALVTAVWLVKIVLFPRPYWALTYGDGEMVFFFNSLLVAEGRRPAEVFHPATPILLAGGLVARLWRHPLDTIQGYLLFWNAFGLLAALLGMALFTLTMLRGATAAVVAATLLVYWLHPSALGYLTIWSSYQLHLLLVVAALLALRWLLRRLDRVAPQDVLGVGAVAGFGCSVQLILLPLLVAALLAVPVAIARGVPLAERPSRWSRRLSRGAAASAVVLTGLSLAMILRYHPVLPGMRLFGVLLVAAAAVYVGLGWSGRLVTRGRIASAVRIDVTLAIGALLGFLSTNFLVIDRLYLRYCSGYVYNIPLGAPDMTTLQNIGVLTRTAVIWAVRVVGAGGAFMALAAVIVVVVIRVLRRSWYDASTDPGAAVDFAEGVALLTALALIAAIPAMAGGFPNVPAAKTYRYLLPGGAVVMFMVAWLGEQARRAAPGSLGSAKWAAIAFIVVACASQTIGDVLNHLDARAAALLQDQLVRQEIDDARHRLGREPLVVVQDVARPAWALRWGSFHADQRFDAVLDRRFPTEREINRLAPAAEPGAWSVMPRDGRQADLVILRGDADPRLVESLATLGPVSSRWSGPSGLVVITPRNSAASTEKPAKMGRSVSGEETR